jgi:hypothetical protein
MAVMSSWWPDSGAIVLQDALHTNSIVEEAA